MKERDLREAAKCAACEKPFGHTGLPLFWRVTVERYGLDALAVQRQSGLEMMLGGHVALAQAMGLNEDMAKPMMEPVVITLCEKCALQKSVAVGLVALEIAEQRDDDQLDK